MGSHQQIQSARLSADSRTGNIRRLEQEEFDLLIIGGGINGAGVARDASSRGMRVALIEADDFSSGTSSRSSKLIHGGIRYLENLEFGLVFEALSERRLLFELAPHLVHPLRFVIPLYRGGRVGMFKMGLGMWLYDALSLFEAPELHERLECDEVLARLPILQNKELLGAYAYSDAYMDDDRLVIETLRSAARGGLCSANYVRATGAQLNDGKVSVVECEDLLGQRKFLIRARHTVSTVGPWTDRVAPKLVGSWSPILRPSKGVHLTFPRERLPLQEAVVMGAEDRIVFAIPRHEMVIIGTTDTDFPEDPSSVHTDRVDVEYLLGVIARYFPGSNIKEQDILASYSGVRPLVDDRSESEGKTSREHLIVNDPRNVTFVAGGKYTTYRKVAEQTVESLLSFFPLEDQVQFARASTKEPLNPLVTAESYASRDTMAGALMKQYSLSEFVATSLMDRHGGEAPALVEMALARLSGRSFSNERELLWSCEAVHAIHETMCLNVRDFFLRRSHLFLSYPQHGFEFLRRIGEIFAAELGLSQAALEEQFTALQNHLQHEMHWQKK